MDKIQELCASMVELARQRGSLHKAEVSLTLQIKALCRRLVRGDISQSTLLYAALEGRSSHPLLEVAKGVTRVLWLARQGIHDGKELLEAELARHAVSLPIWPRVQATHGLGALSFALLIGATGDLRNYPSHSKLWKRLGLAVIDGQSQRRMTGRDASKHGFSPSRRSMVWNMGSNILRIQSAIPAGGRYSSRPAGTFRLGYDARKAYEVANGTPLAHAHRRAKRYMEKKLVRNIWRAWREAVS